MSVTLEEHSSGQALGPEMGHIVSGNGQRRRPYKTGSIEERGPGVYRLRVVVKDPSTHRLIRRSKTVHVPERGNVKLLEDEMAKFRAEVLQTASVGTKTTVGRLLDEWLENLDPALAQNTVEVYKKRVDKQIRPALGTIRLDQLDTHMIDAFYTKLLSGGLSARSVQLVHSVLRAVLQRGVDWDWLPINPAVRARPPKVVIAEKVALTAEQVAAIYEAAEEPAVKVAIALAATTGMRRGEVCGLKWSDIDLETGLVTIERAWVSDDHGQHLTTTKSKKKRIIPLGPFGEQVLADWEAHQRAEWGELGEWVVSYTNGDAPFSARTLTADFGRLAHDLGIDATFHDLRHFAQSQLVAAGIDPVTAARRGGHTPEVMLGTYAHGTAEQDALAAEVVGSVLMKALEGGPVAT
jgi:integrase